jgi:microcystin-dependent protein
MMDGILESIPSRGRAAGLASALALAGLCLPAGPAQACDSEPMVGAICIFAFGYCPAGFAPLNGALVPGDAGYYQNFKDLFDTTFDPDKQNVLLPDLGARAPMARSSPPGSSAQAPPNSVALGTMRGLPSVALTPDAIPAHAHQTQYDYTVKLNAVIAVSTEYGDQGSAAQGVISAYPSGNVFATPSAGGTMVALKAPTIPTSMGASGTMSLPMADPVHPVPVPIQPPSLGLTLCIATQGAFPPGVTTRTQ